MVDLMTGKRCMSEKMCDICVDQTVLDSEDSTIPDGVDNIRTSNKEDHVSTVTEISELMKQSLRALICDRKLLIFCFGVIWGGSVLVLIIFAGATGTDLVTLDNFQSHVRAIFFINIVVTFITQIVLLKFIEQVPVFVHEYLTNHYTIISYSIHKLFIDLLTTFLQVMGLALMVYWGLGMQSRFWYTFLVIYTYSCICGLLGLALGSFTRDACDAKELVPLTMCKSKSLFFAFSLSFWEQI